MPQPATIIDTPAGQQVVHGCQVITFAAPAGPSVVEEINFTRGPARSITYPVEGTQYGADGVAAYNTIRGTGTMVVQMKGTLSVIGVGDHFTFIHPGNVVVPCIVTDVGVVYTQNGLTKVPLSFAEDLAISPLPKLNFFDGDFETARPCGAIRFSRPFVTGGTDSLVITQRFCQRRENWGPLALNTIGPYAGGTYYLTEETELEDTKVAGLVEWDRVWARKPSPRAEKGSYAKTYKKIFKQWTNGNISAVSISAKTKTIQVDIFYDYYLAGETIPAFPGVPDVAVNSVGIFVWVDNTDGFPYNAADQSPPDSNNFYHFLAGSLEVWKGRIYVKKQIYG